MDIFIGNLPGEATIAELQAFLGDLKLHSDVQHCNGRDRFENGYHYFVVKDLPEARGRTVINRFDGATFHGRKVVAREYVCRQQAATWDGPDRRINTSG